MLHKSLGGKMGDVDRNSNICTNKNAFQSKAHLPLANIKSNTYNLTLEWPWPCNLNLIDNLDLRQVKTDIQVPN